MNKLLLIILLLVSLNTQANNDYSKLVKAAGLNVKVVIIRGNQSSYTDGSGVYLSTEDLGVCKGNKECINGLITHELSHIVLGHVYRPPKKIDEIAADKYSVVILKKAGLNPCSGLTTLKYMMNVFGNEDSDTHPSYTVRIKALQSVCNK